MELAVCVAFPELPWLADPGKVTAAEGAGMRGACRSCGVCDRCAAYTDRARITSGFWAGQFRDPPTEQMDGAA